MKMPEDKLDRIIEILRQHDKRFDRIEADAREDRRKLEKIYDSRKEVVVRFSRNWAWQNMLYSGGVSVLTVLVFLAFFR